MKSLKSIFAIILVLTLITAQVGAVCPPAYWNDPNGTCITQSGYLQFISNWTYWNTSAFTSINAANSAMLFQNGTRIMTGSLNAGGYNISNVSTPVAPADAATKGYVDASNTSQTANLTAVNNTIQNQLSSFATTAYVNNVNTTQTNNLTAVNSTLWSNIGTWNTVAATSASLTVNNGYIPTSATRTQFTLPVSASPGQSVKITGFGSGGWVINQNSGQTIYFTGLVNTTPGTAGNVTSNTAYDSISLRCVATNAAWVAELFTGNLQVN